jgi:hypothetical protein
VSTVSQAQLDSTIKKKIFHGIVKNEKNKPIENASVIVEGDEKGTVSDNLGYFKINARPDAVLVVNAEGYESSLTPVGNEELVRIIMIKSKSLNDGEGVKMAKQQSVSNDFHNYINTESSRNYTGSYLTVFKGSEGTVGSRFLFDNWVPGKLIDKNDHEIIVKGFTFNYDKVGHKLLATSNEKTIIEVEDSAIKSYSFFNPAGGETVFKKVNGADKNKFLIVLVDSPNKKYSLYKSLKTELVKANFTSNGLIQSGNKYDEYVDKFEYYISDSSSPNLVKVDLKEKQIKKAFPNEQQKVNAFLASHKEDKINESLLIELISYINLNSN